MKTTLNHFWTTLNHFWFWWKPFFCDENQKLLIKTTFEPLWTTFNNFFSDENHFLLMRLTLNHFFCDENHNLLIKSCAEPVFSWWFFLKTTLNHFKPLFKFSSKTWIFHQWMRHYRPNLIKEFGVGGRRGKQVRTAAET